MPLTREQATELATALCYDSEPAPKTVERYMTKPDDELVEMLEVFAFNAERHEREYNRKVAAAHAEHISQARHYTKLGLILGRALQANQDTPCRAPSSPPSSDG